MKNQSLEKIVSYITPETLSKIQEILSINPDALKAYGSEVCVTGVYFLYNEGVLVYIGKSKDVYARIGIHRRTKTFNIFKFIRCDESELGLYERILINKYLPELNKDSVTNKIKSQGI